MKVTLSDVEVEVPRWLFHAKATAGDSRSPLEWAAQGSSWGVTRA